MQSSNDKKIVKLTSESTLSMARRLMGVAPTTLTTRRDLRQACARGGPLFVRQLPPERGYVDGGALRDQCFDLVFVQIAARQDFRIPEAVPVESLQSSGWLAACIF